MKQVVSFSLILSLVLPTVLPLYPSMASEIELNESSESLFAQRRRGGGGRRGGRSRSSFGGSRGGSRRHINRGGLGSRGSGRINRSPSRSSNRRGNFNRPSNRPGTRIQPVNRPSTRPGNRTGDRIGNRPGTRPSNRPGDRFGNRPGDRGRFDRRRDINIDSRRRNTNRINRNIINNGNIVVNPRRGWGGWGWNGGSRWYPNYNYWGGGFWGGFAAGALTLGLTSAIVNSTSTSETNYIIIEKDSPGYRLFDSYGLTQVQCDSSPDLVFIYGPQDSLICATPNSIVAAGYYDVDPEDLTLVYRDDLDS